MKKQIFIILFLNFYSIFNLYSWDKTKWNEFIGSAYTESEGYSILEKICDEAGGRLAGSKQNEKAISIMINFLKQNNISAKTEEFTIPGWVRGNDEVIMLEPTERKLQATALGYVDATPKFEAEVVYAKYGFDEDYKDIDVKNKIVVVTQEAPSGKEHLLRLECIDIAAKHRAKAILFINDKIGMLNLYGVANFQGKAAPIPAFTITFEEGKWISRLLERNIPVKMSIEVRSHVEPMNINNVAVSFPGVSSKKIVIGAHIDSWDISQGAVDNGYGTAILSDIARLIKKFSPNNYYTIELVWFNGEELGLWGSKKYLEMHKNDNILAMINMDMTGSPTGVNVMGFDEFITFCNNIDSNLAGFNLSAGISNQPWTNSDHEPFIMEGIPSLTFQAFLEKDMYWYYHAAGDTFDKVNKRFLCDAAAVIGIYTLELANAQNFPFKKLNPEETIKLLKKYKLDDKLKRQGEWKFDKE